VQNGISSRPIIFSVTRPKVTKLQPFKTKLRYLITQKALPGEW